MSLPPRVFISYSHDSHEHKQWVLKLASDLRHNGIDAVIDQWDLCPGDDIPTFMEQSLTTSERVIVVCSERYVQRANNGQGGVGYEKMLVTAELIENLGSKKFIPIVRNGGTPPVPKFLGYRLFISFEEDSKYPSSLETLIRELLAIPDPGKPPIGSCPFNKDGSGEVVISSINSSPALIESTLTDVIEPVASSPDIQPVIKELKQLIADHSHPLHLHDFVMPIANGARSQIEDVGFLDYSVHPDRDEFVRRILHVNQATFFIENLLAIGCIWANDEQSKIFANALSRLAIFPQPIGTFYEMWNHVVRYPLLRVLYAGAVTAIAKGDFEILHRLMIDTKTRTREHEPEAPVLSILHSNAAFAQNYWKWLPDMEQRHFPVSDYLKGSLNGAYKNVFNDDEEITGAFDRYEFFQALVYGDIKGSESQNGFWAPVGSFVWRRRDLFETFRKEIDQAGNNWLPLKAGFFSGSQERAIEMVEKLENFTGQVRRQLAIW